MASRIACADVMPVGVPLACVRAVPRRWGPPGRLPPSPIAAEGRWNGERGGANGRPPACRGAAVLQVPDDPGTSGPPVRAWVARPVAECDAILREVSVSERQSLSGVDGVEARLVKGRYGPKKSLRLQVIRWGWAPLPRRRSSTVRDELRGRHRALAPRPRRRDRPARRRHRRPRPGGVVVRKACGCPARARASSTNGSLGRGGAATLGVGRPWVGRGSARRPGGRAGWMRLVAAREGRGRRCAAILGSSSSRPSSTSAAFAVRALRAPGRVPGGTRALSRPRRPQCPRSTSSQGVRRVHAPGCERRCGARRDSKALSCSYGSEIQARQRGSSRALKCYSIIGLNRCAEQPARSADRSILSRDEAESEGQPNTASAGARTFAPFR